VTLRRLHSGRRGWHPEMWLVRTSGPFGCAHTPSRRRQHSGRWRGRGCNSWQVLWASARFPTHELHDHHGCSVRRSVGLVLMVGVQAPASKGCFRVWEAMAEPKSSGHSVAPFTFQLRGCNVSFIGFTSSSSRDRRWFCPARSCSSAPCPPDRLGNCPPGVH
jgi:hypothetical protein